MTSEKAVRIHRIYNILLSISIFVAGICLIAGCLSIYYSGDQPYSRQTVAEVFSKIAVPVCLCPILAIIGLIWDIISPLKEKKSKPTLAYDKILQRLSEKKDTALGEETLRASINKERKSRKIHSLLRTVILCISGIVFLIYSLNINNFDKSDINSSIIQAMYILIPCLALPFIYSVFTAYYNNKSLKREIDLLKQIPSCKNTNSEVSKNIETKDKIIFALRIVVLAFGVVALIYGFVCGGTSDVLTKAINICTECIGLG